MFIRDAVCPGSAANSLRAGLFLALLCALALVACKSGEKTGPSGTSTTSAAKGGGEFEGTVAMKIDSSEGKTVEMTYFIRGDRSRVEASIGSDPEAQGVMLWDLSAGKLTTLMPKQKMYMTMDFKQMGEDLKGMAEKMKRPGEQEEKKFPKLTPTGKQETIAGYPCEHWLMGDKQEVDMCVAKGLGYFGMGGKGGGTSVKDFVFSPKLMAEAAAHPEWTKFLEGGAFPLKITVLEEGKAKMNMEATRIERKKLDEALFAIPPDYKEFKMPNMPGVPGK